MTWLPVEANTVSERDAVFGLKPDVFEVLNEMLAIARRIADPRLLQCCRLRVAQMMGARAELAGADPQLLAELADWRESAAFSNRERAALAYAEQYHLDHHAISEAQKEELARYLSPREFVNFVWAFHTHEAYARVLALLDVAPDPQPAAVTADREPRRDPETNPEREMVSEAKTVPRGDMWALLDPAFLKVYGKAGQTVVRQKLIDDVTSEAVRLHNASHQGCQY
jgi:alkylhydroperoxidase family enzyme